MKIIYKTDNGILSPKEAFEPDIWINLISPNMEELTEVATYYDVDIADVRAALDEEESSRVQIEELLLQHQPTLRFVEHPIKKSVTSSGPIRRFRWAFFWWKMRLSRFAVMIR